MPYGELRRGAHLSYVDLMPTTHLPETRTGIQRELQQNLR